ncbi:DUF1289 domain-containing protein [Wenzhouxiangella marina]|uniref:Prolyl-tRNA synthetase n=1 Tax=Wenzhouxiangella marina TaxID=1579979 RepID=A0A0K0XXL1_9GAMM|nr:DUF1289 domain-containing protein [Wenzhouxiangella marina]AKS42372.1 prolyl-tRNA synthetase [Wenzhouxiangella marina]MBB6085855.1 hypothetical protein [Wenzhouxiangella marina]
MGEPIAPIPEIESPCIGTCTLGPDALCIGCFRSADEIAAWLSLSAAQRRAIMRRLPERGQRLFDDAPEA